MKILIILFPFLLFISSCEDDASMVVIRDCTGTYLRYHNKDFYVCNYMDLTSFENGAMVESVFTHIFECNNNQTICATPHFSEGTIHVDEISYINPTVIKQD